MSDKAARGAVLLLHSGTSVLQKNKMVLSRLTQNRDNRALRDSQEAMSSHAFELCGCVLSSSMAGSRRVKVRAGGYAAGALCLETHASTLSQLQSSGLALVASIYPRGLGWHQVTDIKVEKQSGMLSGRLLSWTARAAQVYAAYQQSVNKRSQAVWEGFGKPLRVSEGQLSIDVASAFPSQHWAGSTWNSSLWLCISSLRYSLYSPRAW